MPPPTSADRSSSAPTVLRTSKGSQKSFFGEILDWMLTPLLLMWPVSLLLTWLVAQNIADKPFDRELALNVRTLMQFIVIDNQRPSVTFPGPMNELLHAEEADKVFFQILGNQSELLAGQDTIPLPEDAGARLMNKITLRNERVDGFDVRIASSWLDLPLVGGQPVLIQVAETMEKRSLLATEIVKGVMLPQFLVLPLAVLLVWLALNKSMRPMRDLEARIRSRKPDDLSPIDTETIPSEVAPLIDSVNDLLDRLSDSIKTQKRFLTDAAHQLKTPLAGLRMQADLAQREGASAEDLKQSLRQIRRASISATHSVNQLLSLARAESSGIATQHTLCDMAALTIQVVRDSVPLAMDKRIDLGYEGAMPETENVNVWGNPTLLQELVRNLVVNAINYTPSLPSAPGVITVRLLADAKLRSLVLQVEDSGPGVPAAERELIFQPFYRALGSDVDGSGLGLPIVLEIAHQHHASVSVEDTHPGKDPPGARFIVRFKPAFANSQQASVVAS
jgi:two-component system sensor histidine kinase TctE